MVYVRYQNSQHKPSIVLSGISVDHLIAFRTSNKHGSLAIAFAEFPLSGPQTIILVALYGWSYFHRVGVVSSTCTSAGDIKSSHQRGCLRV